MLKRLRPLDVDDYYEGRNAKWDGCNQEEPPVKQQRTTNQFLLFCDFILKYEKYNPIKEEESSGVYSPGSLERTQSFSTESNSSFASSTGSGDAQNDVEAGKDDDSWDLITCHCMKPFAGRPMIECTECQTWVHMSCAKIRRNNIPDDFVCQVCREAKSSTRRSERIRGDEPRRVISTT